ncbi:hypothetical protein [Streptomyces lonegramiae]|uniref:Uncharacterized protein n=1 Tax=Streptomyces lonegramiae TaxID=3075524 RepID=A0ABU2XWP3_9ACTN|nr:hypothetical protein [Streptomyces sp. DSM 41529]MDT0550001.1 hypothetical protein [Streptomyces sp. DSM 41529]
MRRPTNPRRRLTETTVTEEVLAPPSAPSPLAWAQARSPPTACATNSGTLDLLGADPDDPDHHSVLRHRADYTALHIAVLPHKRATVIRLRDSQHDDSVLRALQARLDTKDSRLAPADPSS